MGAGVSVPSGLPSWEELLERLSEGLELPEGFDKLGDLDKAEFIQDQIVASPELKSLGDQVGQALGEVSRPALAHTLLASLGIREAVTTNYDDLYERATRAVGEEAQVVMPWRFPSGSEPWILKMHGDRRYPESIVLTRQSFVGFDSNSRPAGSIFQGLLLTRHLLFVGVSMTDDNLLRLVHEANSYVRSRSDAKESRVMGTLVDVSNVQARAALWKDQLVWLTMPGDSIEERARRMEIFLDAVAMYASSDTSWVLDKKFESLLSAEVRGQADQLRKIAHSHNAHDQTWNLVVDHISQLGG